MDPSSTDAERRKKRRLFLLSLPERSARAGVALAGGAVKTAADHLLPSAIRSSHSYQTVVGRLERFLVETIGDVRGLYEGNAPGGGFVARKTAGNLVELVTFATIRVSPLWFLAMAADASRGTRAFVEALADELRREGVPFDDRNVQTVDGLLAGLEQALGTGADTVDVPPLDVKGLRETWEAFKASRDPLPDAADLAELFRDLQATAAATGRSLLTVSSLTGLGALTERTAGGAARATRRVGRATARMLERNVVADYRRQLAEIRGRGFAAYASGLLRPYREAVRRHFDPARQTFTERRFGRRPSEPPPRP